MVSDEDIEGCAADWLARLDRPDAPAAAHADFEAWCRADLERLTEYLRLLAVWNRLDGVKPTKAPVVLPFGRTRTS